MIVRSWRGRAAADRAHAYTDHLVDTVVPKLKALPGFCGFALLRRIDGQETEFLVQTYWDSMQAIEEFAGPTPEIAVVEPAARDVLTSFDATVFHHEVVAAALTAVVAAH
jgi:heme-degrading monooxygenase HmoA